jgi:PPOX class probable FMN-dependent enzyme
MTTETRITFRDTIASVEQLREIIPPPAGPAVAKEISYIDEHARAFIERAPFLLLATAGASGRCDVSPKGDVPGFVQVLDEHTLVIPDRPGNHRADSLQNIIENPHAGLLMIIPGVEWTLRANGRATIVRDADVLARCAVQGKAPALAIALYVEELFLHCPKCFLRSSLWDTASWMPADEQPQWAAVLRDHTKLDAVPVEVIEKALAADRDPGKLF